MESRKRANPTTHCARCGRELNESTTNRRHDSTTWRSPCKACRAVRRRELHDQAEAERRIMVARDYCDICGQPERAKRNGVVKLLALDHDHRTGEYRGVLCQRCNQAIGMFSDNTFLLESAIRYLKSPPGLGFFQP
jgi:hypothetical protein